MTENEIDFQVIDHGIDGAQYFPGCGTSFTPYEYVATGAGDDFAEAMDDCLESIAQFDNAPDTEALARAIAAEGFGTVAGDAITWMESRSALDCVREANPDMSDDELSDGDSDVYCYVSIRWNAPPVYEVVVGNIGTVYDGPDFAEAGKVFAAYKDQSLAGYGRAAGETVVIMRDGEPMNEWDYAPEARD